MQESLQEKNKELDAMYYVWCSGGCGGGVARYGTKKPTAEQVDRIIRNTERLASWYGNAEFKVLPIYGWRNRFKKYWKVSLMFFALGALIF